MTTTLLDGVISLLQDTTNALSDAGDADELTLEWAPLLAAIDNALAEAYRQQERIKRLLDGDGPDPDRLRDEWLGDQWRSQ
jgi:hypothetical protein